MAKVEMVKYIYLQTWRLFAILPFKGANLIKINLLTCDLRTRQSVTYKFIKQFLLNLSPQIAKKKIQLEIFCHFNLCHNRRNNVWQNMLRWMMRQAVKCRTKNFKTSGKQNLHSLLLMMPACVYTSWAACCSLGSHQQQ